MAFRTFFAFVSFSTLIAASLDNGGTLASEHNTAAACEQIAASVSAASGVYYPGRQSGLLYKCGISLAQARCPTQGVSPIGLRQALKMQPVLSSRELLRIWAKQ
jgi:hypothetical protein